MRIAPIADIKAHLSTYVNEAGKGPVVITKNGKPVAVLLGVTDEEEIERLILAYSPKFQAVLAQGQKEIEDTGGIAHDQFWREVEDQTG
jgi:prevent-host-death family protein